MNKEQILAYMSENTHIDHWFGFGFTYIGPLTEQKGYEFVPSEYERLDVFRHDELGFCVVAHDTGNNHIFFVCELTPENVVELINQND